MLSERTAKDVLVDNSKSLSWARKTLASSEARRYIHLLRDPRAVVNSWRRRGQNKGLEQWVDENKRIAKFLSDQQLDSRAVSYDELAQRTDETLAGLCEWLGLVYELAQKSYWRVEHHGAGRNGATAAFLTDFVASDEAFYAERRRTNFYDTRWREELDAATRRAIERDVRLKAFLQRAGFELTDDGLTPVRASARP
jgi:hypothetical protein